MTSNRKPGEWLGLMADPCWSSRPSTACSRRHTSWSSSPFAEGFVGESAGEDEAAVATLFSELAQFCVSRLPRSMVPESIAVRPALPRTSTGKVDRLALLRSLTNPDDVVVTP